MALKIVIIAAGGSGTRFGSDLPKQYLLLNERPVLMYTIDAFVGIADRIIVVLSEQMKDVWRAMCTTLSFKVPHELVIGGSSRFQSVRNALQHIQETTEIPSDQSIAISIHDAARPFVDRKLIETSFELALSGSSNVLAFPSTNSIRIGDKLNSKSVDRNIVWQVQTPQTFPACVLIDAFQQEESPTFTDDASVVEQRGYVIQLVESTHRNIKLTFAEDLALAKLYLGQA